MAQDPRLVSTPDPRLLAATIRQCAKGVGYDLTKGVGVDDTLSRIRARYPEWPREWYEAEVRKFYAIQNATGIREKVAEILGIQPPQKLRKRKELPRDDDGVAEALGLAGYAYRWNVIAWRPEIWPPNGSRWERAAGTALEDAWVAMAKVAACRRHKRSDLEPFSIPGARMEARFIGAVCRRNMSTDGEGSMITEAVTEFVATHPGARMTTTEVIDACKPIKNTTEGAARAPAYIEAEVTHALRMAEAVRKVGRRPGRAPMMLWHFPGQQPSAVLLS